MRKQEIRLKFYGVRGSYPPTTTEKTQFGVNTACLRLDAGEDLVIFDAGTGIVKLGQDLMEELNSGRSAQNLSKIHLLFSHTHIDHLFGFPYFNMIYVPHTSIHIMAPSFLKNDIENVLDTFMDPAFFPVTMSELPCDFRYYEIGENREILFFGDEDFLIQKNGNGQNPGDSVARVTCLRNYTHPRGGSYTYRIESASGNSIVFATDIEGYIGGDQRLIRFAKNAKALIHDAQYSPEEYKNFQGYGHSTYEMACQVAREANVEQLVLFHHDPKHSDRELIEMEQRAKKLFPETVMATEGMEIRF